MTCFAYSRLGSGAWFASDFGVVWDIWGLGFWFLGFGILDSGFRVLDSGLLRCLEFHSSEYFVSGFCHPR
jgi:hypothetical protein